MPLAVRTALTLPVALACALGVASCGSSGGPSGATTAAASGQALKFANCMRTSGVPNFPDPSGGRIAITPASGVNPQSPAFQKAQNACAKFQTGGSGGPGKPTRAEVQAGLAFAKCMRAHGVPNFPDPATSAPSGVGPFLYLRGMMFKPGPGLDPRSPAFQQAAPKCGLRLPRPPA